MIKTQCDSCHAEVNDYAHWTNGEASRNMYKLICVHDNGTGTYDGMIFCHQCIRKLLYQGREETKA